MKHAHSTSELFATKFGFAGLTSLPLEQTWTSI